MISVKVLASTLTIFVHSWYPSNCCSGNDCRPVPCKELIVQDNGNVKYKNMEFSKEQKKYSPDGLCHVCHTTYPICVFFPAGS